MTRSLDVNRFFALVPLLLAGCGYESYEARLAATERRIRDERILNAELAGALADIFQEHNVYLRVPTGLARYGEFFPVELPEGFFEIGDSFMEQAAAQGGQATGPYQLHVLVRHETEEAEGEQQEQEEEPAAPRGDFVSDLYEILRVAYGVDASTVGAETVNKTIWPRGASSESLTFDRLKFTDPNGVLVHVYIFQQETPQETSDVALIWEFPTGEAPTSADNPVDLSLGTFAVGSRAARYFQGNTGAGIGGGGAGDDTGGGVVAF